LEDCEEALDRIRGRKAILCVYIAAKVTSLQHNS
jgi:hypothetical protein